MGCVFILNRIKNMQHIGKYLGFKRYYLIDNSFTLFRQGWVFSEKTVNDVKIKFTINDGSDASIKILTKLKIVFSIQLPNIPRLYIRKQLLDKKHVLMTLIKFKGKRKIVIGSCCFRIFEPNQFIELIFFAICTTTQGFGYGTYLMSFLKDFANSMKIKYIVTCADNYAITFFLKQGFSRILTNPVSIWFRHIREYEEIELMECMIGSKNSHFFSHLSHILQRSLFIEKFQRLLKSKLYHSRIEKKNEIEFNLSYRISEKQKGENFEIKLFSILDNLRSNKLLNSVFEPIDTRKLRIFGFYEQFINSIDIRSLEEKIRSGKTILTKKILFNFIKRIINNSLLYNGNQHTLKEVCLNIKKIFNSLEK